MSPSWDHPPFSALVGRRVTRVEINVANNYLRFHTEAVLLPAGYAATGDCCSHSWFAAINGLASLLGQVVVRIESRVMPNDDYDAENMHCIQYYGWSIVTARGYCDIEMRNESNGYYGGDVEFIDELDLPWCLRNPQGMTFRELTADFSN